MCSIRFALIVLLLVSPVAAAAHDHTLLKSFSACAGRYSAEMERHWLHGRPGTEAEARRAQFVTLIEALFPSAIDGGLAPHQALSWRIDAKMAQATLLQSAEFATDPAMRTPAAHLAARYITACRQLLLSS